VRKDLISEESLREGRSSFCEGERSMCQKVTIKGRNKSFDKKGERGGEEKLLLSTSNHFKEREAAGSGGSGMKPSSSGP